MHSIYTNCPVYLKSSIMSLSNQNTMQAIQSLSQTRTQLASRFWDLIIHAVARVCRSPSAHKIPQSHHQNSYLRQVAPVARVGERLELVRRRRRRALARARRLRVRLLGLCVGCAWFVKYGHPIRFIVPLPKTSTLSLCLQAHAPASCGRCWARTSCPRRS